MTTVHVLQPRPAFSLFCLLSITTATSALSLSSFQPSVDLTSLTSACAAAYTNTVPGCSASDFAGSGCSNACINGLVSTSSEIWSSCSPASQNYQLLIGLFLAGDGVSFLCPHVVTVTVPPSTTPDAPTPTPTPVMYGGGTSFEGNSWLDSSLQPTSTPMETSAGALTSARMETSAGAVTNTGNERTGTGTGTSTRTETLDETKTRTSSLIQQSTTTQPQPTPPTTTRATSTTLQRASSAMDAVAAHNSCIVYDSNPFNSCEDVGKGNAAAGMAVVKRSSLWALISAWTALVVLSGSRWSGLVA